MTASSQSDVTRILRELTAGDPDAATKLMPLVYDELRELASRYMRHERPDHTLQATALVHDAYLRLIDATSVDWKNRAHFFGVAARLMREILVEHARAHQAAKRGGGMRKVSLDDAVSFPEQREFDLVALDEALMDLAALDSQQAKIVELRFFGGLTIEETAEVLGISASTVKREWISAKAWLRKELIHDS